MGVFARFKERQQLRRVAENLDKLAETLPTKIIKASFPGIDHIDFRNQLVHAAMLARALRRTI
jgi:hypothetical protein